MSARNQPSAAPGVGSWCGGWSCPRLFLGGLRVGSAAPRAAQLPQQDCGAVGGVLVRLTMAQVSKARLIPLFPCLSEALGVLGGTAGDAQVTLCVEQAGWMPGLSADKQPPPSVAAFWF